jgi:transcriptional regulator with XRE-family HTH domain
MDLFDIGDQVREKRKSEGMTQAALANKAGLSRNRLNQLENGACSDMNFNTVMNVLHVLGMELRLGDFNAGRPTLDDMQREEWMQMEDHPMCIGGFQTGC